MASQPASASSRRSVITVEHLSKRFGAQVSVNDVSFEVYEGEIFGFIGPSGSGKTTTMRLITGIYEPSGGRVRMLGQNPHHSASTLHERYGYMPQLFVLYPSLSVMENMNFVASIYGMPWWKRKAQVREALDFVELWEHRGKLAGNISGGMQRRLELAATLVHHPTVIFVDEPTAGIDPILRVKFWEEFRKLRDAGRTLFVTTQYIGESEYCDRVGVINKGRLIAIGTPVELRRRALGGSEAVDLTVDSRHTCPMLEQILKPLPTYRDIEDLAHGTIRVYVADAGEATPDIAAALLAAGVEVKSLSEYKPNFDEVFFQLMEQDAADHPDETQDSDGVTLERLERRSDRQAANQGRT